MAKTPQQANAKWIASTSTGEQTWAENLQQTTKPIVSAAIAARDRMQAHFNQATQPGGSWQTNLENVGDQGIKQAAVAKKANYTTGVQQAGAKQLAAITKVIAYEQAGLPAIYAMPKGGQANAKARMNAWSDYMAAGKGQLGA